MPRPGVRPIPQRARPRPEVAALPLYRVAQHAPVRLNRNESPADWPADLKRVVLERVAARAWHRYPEADAAEVRAALARLEGVDPEMMLATNGSNEAILGVLLAFAAGGAVVFPVPGYSMVRALAASAGARLVEVPLRPNFALDPGAVLAAARHATARQTAAGEPAADGAGSGETAPVVFLTSPNNPTGNAFSPEAVEAVVRGAPGLVVVDEAYAAFAGRTHRPLLDRYPHVALLRTASKALALAGARIGWIVADPEVIGAVRRALPPYTLNVFSLEAARAAAERPDLVAERVRTVVAERERLAGALREVPGVTVFPSDANFLLFRTPLPAPEVAARLLAHGVLVRDVSAWPALAGCLRVSVGQPGEDDRFVAALRRVLGEGA
ncbi:MAG: aminotransferase class I/II-fold pyridoxal phosphate-dependent enzyme [Armatimonadota bacterium]|nr:aminotransferase class I/II-fold pyridoxal phosphate-dependent enzyme [Armatimonadota bacterium]MDR7448254.1 aminotransferase class I/II-fold pyridoxal phosphate-dependent enzyme [Armatimonadota bacterium]MDR7458285.1 aminotransferase class I/II-fold pyridoxal phosphate-dependent enzyme [Armatimonadota bacterium]MDR7478412.1 aminotransferase class I/II-fold pyridoxal phosphate-dependent enzyme [Armatimonadota bacterium]MDR7487346.1 aminotransferase class I/II-fold pyridoxal phosphate-depende